MGGALLTHGMATDPLRSDARSFARGSFEVFFPKCKGPMRVIALIEDPRVIRRILEHLGLWAPDAIERGPRPHAPNASIR